MLFKLERLRSSFDRIYILIVITETKYMYINIRIGAMYFISLSLLKYDSKFKKYIYYFLDILTQATVKKVVPIGNI